ncbi:hypothetical protein VTK73DRAFT_6363 [Phialemonium thermophilum]|uniref:Uncharacterized protein n=1 Tax=Phialemonium thermophilum TaxID=223376 RepID=A0ABR3V1C3_9PEZI
MVRHWVGISLARCSSFSSSSLLHSIFLMLGSSHSFHRALHCLGVLRASSDDTRAHWLRPYLDTEALRISSSMLVHTPPLTTGMVARSSAVPAFVVLSSLFWACFCSCFRPCFRACCRIGFLLQYAKEVWMGARVGVRKEEDCARRKEDGLQKVAGRCKKGSKTGRPSPSSVPAK